MQSNYCFFFAEEGNPKRKLRKRRAKRTATPAIETPPVSHEASAGEDEHGSFAISSRGRVRRVKKIINYDTLDFDKLATQAKSDVLAEKERKKRKREDEADQEVNENGEVGNSDSPSVGVKRYLLSKSGQVMGFIDNGGQVHSCGQVRVPRPSQVRSDGPSQSKNVSGQLNNTPSAIKDGSANNSTSAIPENKQPTVVVAAINDKGAPVYVRVVGNQALLLLKYTKPLKGGPVSLVKLQHDGQTYTVNKNAHMSYSNIPGLPDSSCFKNTPITVNSPQPIAATAGVSKISTNVIKSTPRVIMTTPSSSNATSIPTTSVTVPHCSTPNTVALAYRGIPSITSRVTSQPSAQNVQSQIAENCPQGATLSATTNLVSAIPTLVSSVSPYQASTKINPNVPKNIISTNSPIASPSNVAILSSPVNSQTITQRPQLMPKTIVQQTGVVTSIASNNTVVRPPTSIVINKPVDQTTSKIVQPQANQQQMQVKLGSESLVQLIQRAGNKIVAVPNGKGGYTLSMTPIAAGTDEKPVVPKPIVQTSVSNATNLSTVNVRVPQQQVIRASQNIQSPIKTQIKSETISSPSGQIQENVAQPTRYVLQPQILNQGIAPVLSQTSEVRNAKSITDGQNTAQVTPQKTVIVGTPVVAHQQPRIVAASPAGTNQQFGVSTGNVSASGAGVQRTVLINQQGQQIIRLASNSVIQTQQPQQQLVRLQQPISSAGGHKILQVVQPGGRGGQVIQMIQQVGSSPQGTSNSGVIQQSVPASQVIQQISNNNIRTQQLTQQHPVAASNTVTQVQLQPNQQQVQQHTVAQPAVQVQLQQPSVAQPTQLIQAQPATQVQLQPQTASQPAAQVQLQSQPARVHIQAQRSPLKPGVTATTAVQSPQTQGSRLVLLRTNQGEKMGLQLPDGRLTILSAEQLQTYNIKTNVQQQPQ